MIRERLDRQMRIVGWDQSVLDKAVVGVVGDDDLLASLFVLSASALGVNRLILVAPRLDPRLVEAARRLNPEFDLVFLDGFLTHPAVGEFFGDCAAIVDLSRYGLANKTALERGFREGVPVIRGGQFDEGSTAGFRVFSYLRGREWQELEAVVSATNFPRPHANDPVLDVVLAGLTLEELKNVLMGGRTSEDLIAYERSRLGEGGLDAPLCVVGAGALGNFVGYGLLQAGFSNITFIDPDRVEAVNLNRQVFFFDAVGKFKAEVLAERFNRSFSGRTRAEVAYVRAQTDLSAYEAVFDCVDNFESRIVLSERCQELGKPLISGGTSVTAGQVIAYDPKRGGPTPAELLGMQETVDRRRIEAYARDRASCTLHPDPSVIMTNEIIAGFMVDAYRRLLNGDPPLRLFYDATSDKKF